jgi:5'-3' exonuclease
MGIPYYFSHIVKCHSTTIKKLENLQQIQHFFLDCNSIIYDIVNHALTPENPSNLYIIQQVIQKIEYYIQTIQPCGITFIAFDGVAPMAKLKQQKERRYKSCIQEKQNPNLNNKKFPTCQITPGTSFMDELNIRVTDYFSQQSNIIVCGSNKVGEGEHKLFHFIRNSEIIKPNDTLMIYGLDADLIMLCIHHLSLFPNIYLYRETPEFIKYLSPILEPNELYYLDIPLFVRILEEKMGQKHRMYDYVFICFMLGNDFLPHFPAVNIRTGGIDKLLNAYKKTFSNNSDCLTDGKIIYWNNFKTFLSLLAEKEHFFLKNEIESRDHMEKTLMNKTDENIPQYERDAEKYINPFQKGWKERYYNTLFSPSWNRSKICENYLKGLEWTLYYYTSGCIDWRWYYQYHYPPLLQDLYFYLNQNMQIIQNINKTFTNSFPLSPQVQLAFVLPKPYLFLLPEPMKKKLLEHYGDTWYSEDCVFEWSFCKYFWESHVCFPSIDMDTFEMTCLESF